MNRLNQGMMKGHLEAESRRLSVALKIRAK